MSFSRARRGPIDDPHPHFDHHHRFSHLATAAATMPTTSQYSGGGGGNAPSLYLRKQNRDRAFVDPDAGSAAPPLKRRRPDAASRFQEEEEEEQDSRRHQRDDPRRPLEQDQSAATAVAAAYMSRDEIERCSPSRKDGIDALMETHLRYSYCSYLQSLGMRLEMPQTTIGTAMVLCHRFFVRRSHASHDRFLIATAALFLATKSEETPCLLNTVLRASCEVCQKQNFAFFPYLVYSHDWFEQYRERVIEAEQMILTTLDFELDVHHPYVPLTSVLSKLGLSHLVLLNLAWNLIGVGFSPASNSGKSPKALLSELSGLFGRPFVEPFIKSSYFEACQTVVPRAFNFPSLLQPMRTYRLRSSLWLQFKPHHIAAGAAFLAARFLNFDLSYYQNIWHEFKTTPSILQDVVQQLMELF